MTTVPTPSDSQDGARRRDDADGGIANIIGVLEERGWRMDAAAVAKLQAHRDQLRADVARLEAERDEAVMYGNLYRHERNSAEASLQGALRKQDAALDLLREMVDDDPCDYDHHDYCQTHGLHSRPCANARAIALLAAVDQTAPSSPLETPQAADGGEAGVVEGAGASEAAEGVPVPRATLSMVASELRSSSGHLPGALARFTKHDSRMADDSCCTCAIIAILESYLGGTDG